MNQGKKYRYSFVVGRCSHLSIIMRLYNNDNQNGGHYAIVISHGNGSIAAFALI